MTSDALAARVALELDGLALAPGTWLVAVSGGPDSVALVLLLAGQAAARGLSLVVAHADHGIHPESSLVADRVRHLAARLGLPASVGRLALGAGTTETEARQARYAWLRAEGERHDARGIITAHHADDQAETVLMRALRGSGPAGLAGMSRRAGDLVRPLLPFRRAELAQYLREHGEEPWLDPANTDPRHLRSWIRVELLPTIERRLPGVAHRLIEASAQARLERDAWDAVLDHLPGLDARIERERVALDAAGLATLGDALGAQVLRAAARRAGRTLPLAAARRALRLARDGASGARADMGAGWTAELAFGRIVVAPAQAAPAEVAVPRDGDVRWGAWTLTSQAEVAGVAARVAWHAWLPAGEITVSAPRNGERLRPLGGAGSRSIARLLQEARVPRGARMAWPVLRHEGRPVWIPGVCRSETCVPDQGQEAIRIDVHRA